MAAEVEATRRTSSGRDFDRRLTGCAFEPPVPLVSPEGCAAAEASSQRTLAPRLRCFGGECFRLNRASRPVEARAVFGFAASEGVPPPVREEVATYRGDCRELAMP